MFRIESEDIEVAAAPGVVRVNVGLSHGTAAAGG